MRKCRFSYSTRSDTERTHRDPAMTDPQKPKLHESFYSVFSFVFGCIMLGLVAYLAYDWLQG